MALISSYLVTTKNLDSFFNSLITAQAPAAFTQKFLESLEFKSTNDRLFIALLKSLGFLDPNAVPTERYFRFLDQSQSKIVLAEAIREAYSDLFAININAQNLSVDEVKNKLRTLTQGKNSDQVLRFMANTFTALASYAEWKVDSKKPETKKDKETTSELAQNPKKPESPDIEDEDLVNKNSSLLNTQLHYNIQIHLPESRDPAVYDVLFKSLKKHLF